MPGDDYGPALRDRGRAGRRLDLRGRVEPDGPIAHQAAGGAELAVNLNASPYYAGRLHERETMLATRAADASVPVVYANLVGGQDELVFDGGSLVIDEQGELVARAKQFEEDLLDRRPRRARRIPEAAARPSRPTEFDAVARSRGERGAPRRAPVTGPDRAGAARGARGLRSARARHSRLRAQERFRRRAHRALGRGRLRDRGDDRGRCPRCRPRDRRDDAVAVLERSQHHRRRGRRRQSRDRDPDWCRSSPRIRRSRRCSPTCSRARPQASPKRTCSRASAATC